LARAVRDVPLPIRPCAGGSAVWKLLGARGARFPAPHPALCRWERGLETTWRAPCAISRSPSGPVPVGARFGNYLARAVRDFPLPIRPCAGGSAVWKLLGAGRMGRGSSPALCALCRWGALCTRGGVPSSCQTVLPPARGRWGALAARVLPGVVRKPCFHRHGAGGEHAPRASCPE
jgi:hypothetical protein